MLSTFSGRCRLQTTRCTSPRWLREWGELWPISHNWLPSTTEVRQIKIPQHGARSMSLADAMHPHNVLCDEMKGAARPQPHGFPLRLIAPGWYGIANVEWLKRIEIRGTRFMGRVMARDY